MLNYSRYKFTAKFIKTNRFRTRVLEAKNLESAKQSIIEQGYQIPESIIELKHDIPTEAQLNYAKDLGIDVSLDDTKEDLIALLDKKLSSDSEPKQDLIDYADSMGLFFSLYTGKRRLYNLIYNISENEDKYAFFVFSIYRHLSNDRRSNLALHPHKALIYQIARNAVSNQKIMSSMDRYAGEDLRFFGSLTMDDLTYEGGSENTYAYKLISEEVSNKFGTKKTRRVNLRKEEDVKFNKQADKILGLVIIVLIVFSVGLVIYLFS